MAHIDPYISLFSGGADPSIHFWDLESRGSELEHIHRPLASVHKLVEPCGEASTISKVPQ